MNLEELLQQVDDESLKESIVAVVNVEKERGISSTKKKDKEVLRFKSALKDLGYDREKFEDLDSFISANKERESKTQKSSLTIAQLNDKVQSLAETLETERQQLAEKTRIAKESKLQAQLTEKIGNEFYGSKYLINDLVSNGRVDLVDNKVVFKSGDDIISFDSGLTALKEENKGMLKVTQKAGSGESGGETPKNKEVSFMDAVIAHK